MAATRTLARRMHAQLSLLDAAGKRPISKRGGKRPGAGRPPKGARAGSPHKRRPAHKAAHPVHVVLRAIRDVGSLRTRRVYQAVQWATLTVVRKFHEDEPRPQFRIVHASIQRTHIHLLV